MISNDRKVFREEVAHGFALKSVQDLDEQRKKEERVFKKEGESHSLSSIIDPYSVRIEVMTD